MDDKKIKSPLGDVANPFVAHEGVFPDVQDAKFAIRGVLRAFFGSGSDADEDFLFFKRSKVRFEKEPEFDLDFDYRRRILTFVVKEPLGEEAEKLKAQITRELNIDYAVRVSDGLSRTALSIFLSLDEKGRNALIDSEKLREKERGGENE